ncbi:MAG: ATP-binding protein, partial [Acholeplasmataceae bacterium]|nr:ATP-binding protein [Acholeplasmataceae bacterium]
LSIATYHLMSHAAGRMLNAGVGVVLESNFRKHEYLSLIDLAKSHGVKEVTVFVTADDDVLYERFKARHPSRHHVHTSVGLPDRKTFSTWISRYSDIPYDPETLMIDTSDFEQINLEEIVDDLITRIKEPHQA